MNCYICDKENWEVLGNVTEQPLEKGRDLQICKNCGTLCYSVDASKEEEMKAYYRSDYRREVNVTNLLTTTNKQNYIVKFLADYLGEAEKEGKKLVCGDVGCATGYIPAMLRKRGHKATGAELTPAFRRFAESFYGIPVTEELQERKYDFISIYHVLEHMMEPDKKLAKLAGMLKEDGRMLISVPEWHADLEVQSGEELKGVWHYYHKDHINCFTETSIKSLFAKVGLEIEKEDHETYGQSYLVKKAKPGKIKKEDWKKVKETVENNVKAMRLYFNRDFDAAIELVPRFPEAWLALIFQVNGKDHHKQADLWTEVGKVMPNNTRLALHFARWAFQCEAWDKAEQAFTELLAKKPMAEGFIMLGHCQSAQGKHHEAMKSYYAAADICPPKWAEAMDFMCKSACAIPHWEEVAKQKVKEVLWKEAAPIVKPKDKVMDEVAGASKN